MGFVLKQKKKTNEFFNEQRKKFDFNEHSPVIFDWEEYLTDEAEFEVVEQQNLLMLTVDLFVETNRRV